MNNAEISPISPLPQSISQRIDITRLLRLDAYEEYLPKILTDCGFKIETGIEIQDFDKEIFEDTGLYVVPCQGKKVKTTDYYKAVVLFLEESIDEQVKNGDSGGLDALLNKERSIKQYASQAGIADYFDDIFFNKLREKQKSLSKSIKKVKKNSFIEVVSEMPNDTTIGLSQKALAKKLNISVKAMLDKADKYLKDPNNKSHKKILLHLRNTTHYAFYNSDRALFVLKQRGKKKKHS